MKSKINLIYLYVFILFFAVIFVNAQDPELIFKTNQSEYYFLVGEKAILPLEIGNNYGIEIEGTLTYSFTTKIDQNGFSHSSTNSNSQLFRVPLNPDIIFIDLGTSNDPAQIDFSFNFDYTFGGEDMFLSLDGLKVFFVKEESQKQNQEDSKESESQSSKEREAQKKKEQEQIDKEMQEQLESQMKQQELQNQMQNRIQNNQLNQNTQSLKNQMQQELQEKQKAKEEFANNLGTKESFQEKHNEILNEGYTLSKTEIDATDKDNGEFNIEYQNEAGENLKLGGSMQNDTVNSIHSTLDDMKMLDKFMQDERFKKFDTQLLNSGFVQGNNNIINEGNITNVEIEYTNEKNQTAKIKGIIESGDVKKVYLDTVSNWLISIYVLILVLLIVLSVIFIYFKYIKKENFADLVTEKEKPINYKKEARKLLEKSKSLFLEKHYKESYAKASEAVRFYYSYDLDLKKELTCSELIFELKKKKLDFSKAQKCLNICGLVEFAKYKPNKKDFDMVIKLAEEILDLG